nr:EOG090X026V [Ilyocryptus agilis]
MDEELAPVFQEASSSASVFKRPVFIGKRPGSKVMTNKPTVEKKSEADSLTENIKEASCETSKQEEIQQLTNVQSKSIGLDYREPSWSGVCKEKFMLEILKNGKILEVKDLSVKAFYVIGRLPGCDLIMEHPSVSRYHSILQYRNVSGEEDQGWYLYDLGSTHGTFVNKRQIPPRTYCRVRTGHMFKVGMSTRLFILQGPEEDQEPESALSVTELLELKKKRASLMENLENKEETTENERSVPEDERANSGIDWGMGEDAEEENPHEENPFAVIEAPLQENLYLDDPKKTLRGWFEREGYELEYMVEEKNYAHFVCRVNLPLDSYGNAAPVIAEASVKGGKKKEAVVQCALEACRILDRHGLLRSSNHESRAIRRKRVYDEDHYSSDEDTFFDRTGAVERKRKSKIQGSAESVETYESLMSKYEEVENEIARHQKNLADVSTAARKAADIDADDLDAYMAALEQTEASGSNKKKSMATLKADLLSLTREQTRLRKLIDLARPASLPPLKPISAEVRKFPVASPLKQLEREPAQPRNLESNAEKRFTSARDVVNANNENPVPCDKKREPEKPQITISQPVQPTNQQIVKDVIPDEVKTDEVPTSDAKQTSGLITRKRKKHEKKSAEAAVNLQKYDDDKFDSSKYAMWVPPENQSGDGKNALNRKLGY